jgi:hypothetical protein
VLFGRPATLGFWAAVSAWLYPSTKVTVYVDHPFLKYCFDLDVASIQRLSGQTQFFLMFHGWPPPRPGFEGDGCSATRQVSCLQALRCPDQREKSMEACRQAQGDRRSPLLSRESSRRTQNEPQPPDVTSSIPVCHSWQLSKRNLILLQSGTASTRSRVIDQNATTGSTWWAIAMWFLQPGSPRLRDR